MQQMEKHAKNPQNQTNEEDMEVYLKKDSG